MMLSNMKYAWASQGRIEREVYNSYNEFFQEFEEEILHYFYFCLNSFSTALFVGEDERAGGGSSY